ncbi:hypothetical protein B0H21DRAFT_893945 [Amylocystis lapponica]|nr:hypothetical protein B0H21DRAFT_893945 [Amylocystis lapponica]
MPTTRWTSEGPPESAFHELVVLPTLAPQLACPDSEAGQPSTALQATHNHDKGISSGSGAAANNPPQSADGTGVPQGANTSASVPEQLFFVLVSIMVQKKVPSGRTMKIQKTEETKNTTEEVAILSLTRTRFVTVALSAHGLQHSYLPGPSNGPGMKIHWKDCPGGKTNAPTIHTDDDWVVTLKRLSLSKATVNTVCVSFDLNSMEGYRNHKRALSPDFDSTNSVFELSFGTNVPNADMYSPEQRILAQTMEQIKAEWKCATHGTCYITADGEHIEMNVFRLKQWARAVLANGAEAKDPPPAVVVNEWTGKPTALVKPRRRTGPYPAGGGQVSTNSTASSRSGQAELVRQQLPLSQLPLLPTSQLLSLPTSQLLSLPLSLLQLLPLLSPLLSLLPLSPSLLPLPPSLLLVIPHHPHLCH